MPSFADLGVPAPIVASLRERGITEPFPIQAASLPDSLAGRDVLGRGRTGSGKTVAFSVPLLATLDGSSRRREPGRPRALVLVPTRELATQVLDTLAPLAQSLRLRTMTIFGGVGQNPQVTKLRNGVDVVVATPGRLEDLIGQGHCDLSQVEVTVLDEADHMADLGFLPAVRRLLDRTPRDAQRLLFSATLDNGVDTLVKRYLSSPVTHSVDDASSPVPDMEHHVLTVTREGKPTLVDALVAGQGRTLAFTRTKHHAKRLAKKLTTSGIPAVELHGNLSQNARQRNLAAFADGSVRVLVATDIAARGIHVDDVGLVVHVDPPAEHKAYLHRSGRTARAGASGVVVTVATPDQRRDVRSLMRAASIKPAEHDVAVDDAIVARLVGPEAERVAPPAPDSSGGGNGGRGNGGRGNGGGRPGGSRGGDDVAPRSGSRRRRGGRSRGGRGGARPAASGGSSSGRSGGGRTDGSKGRPAGSQRRG
ncbi:superfamily II DNA/RNA helicase [Mumia flava]|uniref:Superfamily II DNA/RNA helicase n=1 Tax=Mumia flava TaxID=1348852 RepID=A0A2M9BH27_9ACTN|nr:DEAD/DEAH box helicase [Mumia flava]PJJ57257.1 superfamily II DNA/RNA helicase [Mumia flava]